MGPGAAIGTLVTEWAWEIPAAGASPRERWEAIAPESAGHVVAVGYDVDSGRLTVAPESAARAGSAVIRCSRSAASSSQRCAMSAWRAAPGARRDCSYSREPGKRMASRPDVTGSGRSGWRPAYSRSHGRRNRTSPRDCPLAGRFGQWMPRTGLSVPAFERSVERQLLVLQVAVVAGTLFSRAIATMDTS